MFDVKYCQIIKESTSIPLSDIEFDVVDKEVRSPGSSVG